MEATGDRPKEAVSPSEEGTVPLDQEPGASQPPKNYAGKSLRRASTSIAAARRIDKKIRQVHGGWADPRMPDVYTEVSKPEQLAVSKSIHDTVMKSKRARGRKVRFEFNV